MYDPTRLEWHLGDEAINEPRRVLCGLVVRQASLLNSFNRLAVALAKSQDRRKARGQFPNNPCGWSNHQAEGRTVRIRSMMIPKGGGTCSFLLHWGGVGGSLGGIY